MSFTLEDYLRIRNEAEDELRQIKYWYDPHDAQMPLSVMNFIETQMETLQADISRYSLVIENWKE